VWLARTAASWTALAKTVCGRTDETPPLTQRAEAYNRSQAGQ